MGTEIRGGTGATVADAGLILAASQARHRDAACLVLHGAMAALVAWPSLMPTRRVSLRLDVASSCQGARVPPQQLGSQPFFAAAEPPFWVLRLSAQLNFWNPSRLTSISVAATHSPSKPPLGAPVANHASERRRRRKISRGKGPVSHMATISVTIVG
jgi:hypothetical protein